MSISQQRHNIAMRKSVFTTLDQYPDTGRSLVDAYDSSCRHAQLAEELGFHGMWVAEHHFHNIGSIPNPSVLLSALARCTQTLRLGPAISVLPFQHARGIAEDYAMVDILSNGRLNMGVGIGNSQVEFDTAQIDFEGRRGVFEERLAELKAHWTKPSDAASASLNVAPVQASGPPIYVATMSPDRAHQAGRMGDSVLTVVSPTTDGLSTLEAVVEAHRCGLSESDLDTQDAELVATVYAHAAPTEEQAFQTAAEAFSRLLGAETGNEIPDPQALCRGAVAKNTVFVGNSAQVADQIRGYSALGVTHLSFLCDFGGMTSSQVTQSIRYLAEA